MVKLEKHQIDEHLQKLANNLQYYIKDACKYIAKMEQQLTDDQAFKLVAKFPLIDLKRQLAKMDNWKGIEKKNRSVYQTVLRWFDLDIQRGLYIMKDNPNPMPSSTSVSLVQNKAQAKKYAEELWIKKFLKEHPIGSEFNTMVGYHYKVISDTQVQRLLNGEPAEILFIKYLKRNLDL
ncbi:MAG TPA: hypothetical protein PLC04_07900 [Candidatus Kapabacteria bacterium]|nr:hypothetical protein [Candidatus Kapabacteria bacterium]